MTSFQENNIEDPSYKYDAIVYFVHTLYMLDITDQHHKSLITRAYYIRLNPF